MLMTYLENSGLNIGDTAIAKTSGRRTKLFCHSAEMASLTGCTGSFSYRTRTDSILVSKAQHDQKLSVAGSVKRAGAQGDVIASFTRWLEVLIIQDGLSRRRLQD